MHSWLDNALCSSFPPFFFCFLLSIHFGTLGHFTVRVMASHEVNYDKRDIDGNVPRRHHRRLGRRRRNPPVLEVLRLRPKGEEEGPPRQQEQGLKAHRHAPINDDKTAPCFIFFFFFFLFLKRTFFKYKRDICILG